MRRDEAERAAADGHVDGRPAARLLLVFILRSQGKERVYLALALVPVWFFVALLAGVTAITESSG